MGAATAPNNIYVHAVRAAAAAAAAHGTRTSGAHAVEACDRRGGEIRMVGYRGTEVQVCVGAAMRAEAGRAAWSRANGGVRQQIF